MNAKCSIVLSLLVALGSGTVMAQEFRMRTADDVREAMFHVLAAIEDAASIEPNASKQVAEMSDAAAQMLFSSMEDADQFIATAQRITDRVDSARLTRATGVAAYPNTGAAVASYTPSYPGNNVHYVFLETLGLVDSPDDRCGDELAEYEAFVATLQQFSFVYETICTVVSCDPTGIVCAVACSLVGIINVAIDTAALPLRACSAHGGNVNSAEIEAAYENTVLLLGGLGGYTTAAGGIAGVDAPIARRLDALDAVVADILANQERIIKLLNAQQGRPAAKVTISASDPPCRSGG